MATCGEYELERAIGWGRRSTFFAARVTGASGPSVVVIRRARTVERALSHAFLRAAAEQQTAVGAGCRRLAPILSFASDEAGFAYYATAKYETSLADFLEADCKVDSAQMRSIVSGVLIALAELQEKSRRAHGNLTPGNILLDPQGHIFLTDLAPAAKDATTADDLFALGTLIYQLVRRTARIGLLNPPLDYSQAWTDSLGDDAEGWREFTNRVLNKSRNKGPDALVAAASDLKALGSLAAKATVAPVSISPDGTQRAARKAPPKKKSPLLKIIVLILLVAGGGGGFVWWKKQAAAEQARKQRQLEDEKKQSAQKARPQAVKDLQEELKLPFPPPIPGDTTLVSLLGRIRTNLEGTGGRDDVRRLLGNWEVPDQLRKQAAEWRNAPREWNRLADELSAAAEIDLEGETSILRQLAKAITARNDANDLDRQWGDIALSLGDLKATNNRLLPDFTPWAVNEILFATSLADGKARAQSAVEKLRDVLTFQREMGPRVQWTRFESDAPGVLRPPSSELMPGWPAKWKNEAARFIVPADSKREDWNKLLADAEARIGGLPPKEQPAWQGKFVTARTASKEALESDVAAVDRLVAEFKGLRLPMEIAAEQYAAFRPQWRMEAAKVQTRPEANAVLKKFQTETGKLLPAYQAKINAKDLAKQIADAIATPDKISLRFNKPDDWTIVGADAGAAVYKFRGTVPVAFLALGQSGYAMSAIEMPLSIAKLAGAGGTPPGAGPRIRANDFSPDATDQWLWKGPLDFMSNAGIRSYFAQGYGPGDLGSPDCPATWLSFADAKGLAESMGGQLPTAAQMASAMSRAGATRRLRASGWTAQVNQVLQWNTIHNVPTRSFLPDVGSFSKLTGLAGNIAYLSDTNAAPNATDDRALWLKSVIPAGGWKPEHQFHHLIGNAAEWVDDNGKPAVMGGSIVSPPSLPTNAPLPVPGGGGAFDVTFRLVVSTGAGGAGDWLLKFQEAVGKVPPAP